MISINEMWTAEVVNVEDDPEKSGRAQIRIHGYHDDKARIPDEDLPWARPLFPITNPSLGGVATQQTGLMKGSFVMGFFADPDRQHPLIAFTMGKAGEERDDGTLDTDNSDILKTTRAEDVNQVVETSITELGSRDASFREMSTTAPTTAGGLLQKIKNIDPSNLSGVLGSGCLDGFMSMSSVNSILDKAKSLASQNGDILGAISGLTDSLSSIDPASSQDLISALQGVNINTLTDNNRNNIINDALQGVVSKHFGGVNEVVRSIATPSDISNLTSSFGFMQDKVMPNIEQGFSMIKARFNQ